ncbi:MAG: RNA polymerase sigma-70 factor [Sphingobacteriaceae bacterium]|nr:RNA polymerase sigma-70 factor [Sphingobacteriaceae bacterium]
MAAYGTFTDEELIGFLKEGDHSAFTEIYHRYWRKLFYVASKKLGNMEEAEEVVQNIFMSLWNRRAVITITTTLAAYLTTSVKYWIIKILDKQYHQQKYSQSIASNVLDDSTQQWLEFLDLKETLDKYVSELPEKCQLVFSMSRNLNMSQKQIAHELNISEKTVEAHMGKAIKTLRARLNQFFLTLL